MSTHLCILLCLIASVQRGTAQGGTRLSNSELLTSVTSLKNEGSQLKTFSKNIKDTIYFNVNVSGDSDLTTMLNSLRTMGHDLLVQAENVRYYAESAISELGGQAPSHSAIHQDMVDTVFEVAIYRLQINAYKAAMQNFTKKAKARDHSNDAVLAQISGWGDSLLAQTATVETHAKSIASQLQGGKDVR